MPRDGRVLRNLKIEHAHANVIGPVLEGVLESGARFDGARAVNLERHPRPVNGFHECGGLFRRLVVEHVVAWRLVAGRPAVFAVEGLHVEIRLDPGLFACRDDAQFVAGNTGDDAAGLDVFDGFGEEIDLAFPHERIAHLARREYARSRALQKRPPLETYTPVSYASFIPSEDHTSCAKLPSRNSNMYPLSMAVVPFAALVFLYRDVPG